MKYEINVENVPTGMVDADFQRICQTYCNIMGHHSPSITKADQIRDTWKVLGTGSTVAVRTMLKAIYGWDIPAATVNAYTHRMLKAGELQRISHGRYEWIGSE